MNIKVNNDEFCLNCMEWQEYDEKGRCVVCGKVIKRNLQKPHIKSYDEYQQNDFERETDNENNGNIE